jgi:methyl-accepting chemotaxis protein
VNETLSGYNTEQQALDELQGVYEHLTQGATRVKDLGEQVASQSESASQASLQGAGLTQQTTEALKVLDESVASSMRAVEDLSQSSSAISDILNVIRGIAEQTNLLALNAAIEAARAGEQGRGFAVVADEVRNLAKRTQDSTMEIENLVQHLHSTIEGVSERTEASQTEAQNVQSLATQVETQFKEIEAAVDNIRQTSIGNTELSQEQATSMYQANANLESMTHQSRHRKTQVEELAHNASTLNQISEELRKVMMFFKLDEQK